MKIATELQQWILSGGCRLGELEFHADVSNATYILCHWQDARRALETAFGGLARHAGPGAARDLASHSEDGVYRVSKGQLNLRRGWVMTLENAEQLRQALDQFYPAGVGLFLAQRHGTLKIENLRDTLARQTGMYRLAASLSDAGAQRLVRERCGPAQACAKRILWQLDSDTPLEDSEASRFNGIAGGLPESEAIPLLCREACNRFVAACQSAAQAEAAQV